MKKHFIKGDRIKLSDLGKREFPMLSQAKGVVAANSSAGVLFLVKWDSQEKRTFCHVGYLIKVEEE